MAGVSTKEIKNRIRSMESTKQITKAMEMVAASKLRKAQTQMVSSRPYFETLFAAVNDIVNASSDLSSAYLTERPVKQSAYIVIGGDRGLAGGYNSNIIKMVMAEIADKEAVVLPIGRKAVDYFKSHNVPILSTKYTEAGDVTVGECFSIAKQLAKMYLEGQVDEVCLAYTNFVSVLSQSPAVLRLIPVQKTGRVGKVSSSVIYEPDSSTAFDAIIPEYLGGMLYGALCESRTSEHAARRTAMDSATQNADEMIADLSLQFNRARQAAITQEITEIVAGS